MNRCINGKLASAESPEALVKNNQKILTSKNPRGCIYPRERE